MSNASACNPITSMHRGVHRYLVACSLLTYAVINAAPACAQTYPSRPIRLIAAFSAGSTSDILARLIGPKLHESWGQPVVVENRPAAGGVVAGEIVARATPDGQTLLITSSGFSASAALYAKLPYDSVKDFAGVAQVASGSTVLVAAPALGVKSVKELIALAKSKPGQLQYGSAGIGSGAHYVTELFGLAAGISVTHVPYKGAPEYLNDIAAGRLPFGFSPIPSTLAFINSGRVTALAVSAKTRSSALPNLPTVAEAGLPEFSYSGWYGIFVAAATPRRIVQQLSNELGRIIALPEINSAIAKQGETPAWIAADAFTSMVHQDIATRRKVFSAAGVKPE